MTDHIDQWNEGILKCACGVQFQGNVLAPPNLFPKSERGSLFLDGPSVTLTSREPCPKCGHRDRIKQYENSAAAGDRPVERDATPWDLWLAKGWRQRVTPGRARDWLNFAIKAGILDTELRPPLWKRLLGLSVIPSCGFENVQAFVKILKRLRSEQRSTDGKRDSNAA